jgi:hypothetical protein
MAEINQYSGGAPGVYLQRVARAPDDGFTSGVPLFIGFGQVRNGVEHEDHHRMVRPLRLASWEEFERGVEPTAPGRFLRYAVRGFFENGGGRCVVLPVSGEPLEPISALRRIVRKEGEEWNGAGWRSVLDDIDDVDLVCVPDLMIAEIRRSEDIVFELQREVLEYCHDMGERFAILDGLPLGVATESVGAAIRQRSALAQAGEASAAGALYVPWVRVRSLEGSGEECVPASGHIAGIYARSDRRVGFHKAPGNEIVEGVVDLERHISHAEHGPLNESSVNCLRSFPRRGIRVWGARTLSGHRQWRYVNVRRVILTIVRWIKLRMSDLVFEGNDVTLWDRVRDQLSGQCYRLFEQGALKGRTVEEAFFVKCDAELNSAEEREAGRVVCDIGLAPLSPAEFIVMRVTQDRARGTATVVPIRA